MTAGLVAYFMARDGLGGANAREVLYSAAYPRVRKGPPVLWNEVNSAEVEAA